MVSRVCSVVSRGWCGVVSRVCGWREGVQRGRCVVSGECSSREGVQHKGVQRKGVQRKGV